MANKSMPTTMASMATTTPTMQHNFAGMMPWGTDYAPHMSGSMMPYGGGFGGNWMGRPMSPYGGNYMTPFGGAGFSGAGFGGAMAPFGGFDRLFRDLERTFTSDMNLLPSRPSSAMENYSLMNPIRMDADGNRWLNVCFDMRSYKPEEINVTFNSKERYISVEANHEVKDSKDHYVKRHYSRKFYLPESMKEVDLSKVELKSCLTHEGLLCVESALPRMAMTGTTGSMIGSGLTVTPVNVKMC